MGGPDRPNVLVIMTDDARDDDLRFMPHVRHLIGDQGVTFTNTFSPQPLCCPARASFLTGEYSHNHHVWSHAPPYGFQALHDELDPAGVAERRGLRHVLPRQVPQRLRRPEAARRGALAALRAARAGPTGAAPWTAALEAEPALDGGTYRYFDTTLNDNGRLTPHQGVYQTTHARPADPRRAAPARSRPRNPFFTWVSYVAPHHGGPAEADDPAPVLRSDGTTQVFRNPARPRRVWGRFDRQIPHAPGYEGEADVRDKPFFIRGLPRLTPAEQLGVRADARQRAEALSLVDRQVQLDDADAAARPASSTTPTWCSPPTTATSSGEHRMRQGKILPYEPSLRVPLMIRGPGIPAGQVRTDPFTMIDFAPTILAAAGVQGPRTIDGVSLLDVAKRGDRGWTRGILTETGPRLVSQEAEESDNFLVNASGPSPLRFSQGVRTGDFLYVEHASRERELYDLRSDPREVTNLVDRPGMRRVVRLLAHELDVLRNCRGTGCRQPLPASLRTRAPAGPLAPGQPD